MFWTVILVLWTIYGIFIVKYMKKQIFQVCKFTEIQNPNLKEEFKPFERYDRKSWKILEIYFGAIFLLPFRVSMLVISALLLVIHAHIIGVASDKQSSIQYTEKQQKLAKLGQQVIGRIILFSAGYFWIHEKKAKIVDFEPTYPVEKYAKKDQIFPINACNHQSWTDIFALSSLQNIAFLSKSEVKKYPLFGTCAKLIQCLFVDRESSSNKDVIVEQINNRSKQILEGQRFNPINIFPEGTTSNGRYIISFKKGAFEPGQPIRIQTIKYLERNFNPSLDVLPMLPCYLLLSCQLYNRIEITTFDTYYPEHLGITDYDKDWKIYADAIKNIMVKQLKCKSSEAGYRDVKEYEEELKVLKQQLRNKNKKNK